MSLRNILRKAADLVVELPQEEASYSSLDDIASEARAKATARTVAEVVESAPGPNLDQVKVNEPAPASPTVFADGTPNFGAIYQAGGVPAVQFGAEEALQVVTSLPKDLPIEVRRRTVAATLGAMGKSMGVSTDSVVADASRKIAALVSFEEQLTSQTNTYETLIQAKISELQAQIAEQETKLAAAKASLQHAVELCEAEGNKLDEVLEFFTLDVHPSRNAN